ncbi:MAG: histidine--tRNA ligase [Candidatus Hydrogenedentes bacterium]|nr:histidine--tRNA ligase [Candidatus Hydrogenedentota bacterium]
MDLDNKLVTPETLKGFRDYLPADMAARDRVVDCIKRVYERFGFVQIDTPILEHLETLLGTGGEETNKELFRLESPEGEAVAMRFDLTVPFARILAQYRDQVKLPFRRYHIGPVFRADKPGPGRYRQFTQFDIDAAGSSSIAVDAEIVATMCEAMRAVGLASGEFRVRINNRKIVDALLYGCGVENIATHKHILRVVDKLRKVGIDNVRRELGPGRIDDSGDPIPGVKLDPKTIDRLVEFISLPVSDRLTTIEAMRKALPASELRDGALAEMTTLAECLSGLGIPETDAVFDPTLARGLDYYTGPVFEAELPGAPECGSVMGGGRYDGLVERFMDASIPSTGASIGLDRFIDALTRLGKLDANIATTKVMVVSFPGTPESELLRVASELRAAGIATEVYMGAENAGLGARMSYAGGRSIPVAVILGPDELANNTVAVKDLRLGKEKRKDIQSNEEFRKAGRVAQRTVPRAELIATVRDVLAQYGE